MNDNLIKDMSLRITELETICAEAYQVLGCFIDQLPDEKILDNLAEQKLIHHDVLPFTKKE